MDQLDAIVSIASDLTAALSSAERHGRLLIALKRVIPCDAAALLRIEGDELVPIASEGLSEDAMGRRFPLKEHPRLEIICRSPGPVAFPSDTALPDPYDGLLAHDQGRFERVHACLGCPLRIDDTLIGALTADAVKPHAFDGIDMSFFSAVSALAAAEMRTTHLIEALEQSARRQGLIARDLMRDAQLRQGADMIGTSRAMQRLRRDIELVARSDFTVLITGETGVGKELVARAVHAASQRRGEPMLYVNCAALPETLADSELFGHVRGAFTGAIANKKGLFQLADGGSIFFDEIGNIPLETQAKLLRVIQEKEFMHVGGVDVIRVDVRIIAATNADLEALVRQGSFREDLFYRLNVITIPLPALRERREDIPLLARHFLARYAAENEKPLREISPAAMELLLDYRWPGNVRELENAIERAVVLSEGETLDVALLPAALRRAPEEAGAPPLPPEGLSLREAVTTYERKLIVRALHAAGGVQKRAAELLRVKPTTLHEMMKRLQIPSETGQQPRPGAPE